MIYIKEYKVECRIISKSDIKKIVSSIVDNCSENIRVSINASFKSDIQLEDNNISIFDNECFDKEKLNSVYVYISDRNKIDDYYIIRLSRDGSGDYIKIKTENKKAFSAMCHQIEETLKYMKKNSFVCKINTIFGFVLSFIIGGFILPIIDFIVVYKMFGNNNVASLVCYGAARLNIIFILVISRFLSLNQFDFGAESKNKPVYYLKYLLSVLVYIFTQLIIPVIFNLIFSK